MEKIIAVRIPRELFDRLTKITDKRIKRSDIVRMGIELKLKQLEAKAREKAA